MSVYYLVLVAFFMALVPYHAGQQYIDDDSDVEVIGSCQNGYVQNPGCEQTENFNLLITATLDGAVTALDGDTGELIWRHQDAPLLQGTLTSSEPIDIGGTSLQLMPTLDGRLFSYTLNTNLIEPLPITTDSLLESTIRLGQDAVAGGKAVTTKGFDMFTGEQKYECSMESCGNQEAELPENPILLVKRITNSIRAMDTLRGIERWNLSTAEVDISLAGGVSVPVIQSSHLKFLLQPPDGVVVAVNKHNREEWKTEVGGHIVSVWHVSGNQIREVSIFDPSNIFTTQFEVMQREQHNMQSQSSLLYMGTSNHFPFIIQSPKAKRNLNKRMNSLPDFPPITEFANPRFCSADGETNSLAYDIKDETLRTVLQHAFQNSQSKAIEDKTTKSSRSKELQILSPDTESSAHRVGTENLRSTSLSKNGEGRDVGFLVLESEPPRRAFKVPSPFGFMHTVFSYILNPTALISFFAGLVGVSMAVVYNQVRRPSRLMLTQRSSTESTDSEDTTRKSRTTSFAPADDEIERLIEEGSDLSTSTPIGTPVKLVTMPVEKSNIEAPTSPPVKPQKRQAKTDVDTDENSQSVDERKRKLRDRTVSRTSLDGFTSRFAQEFEVKKVIGHGGFGIVFRAQSITDMNEYAVKRIAVADNQKARDRVLREARALAMFDHPGIIRYFYAWEERPPKEYQDKENEILLVKIKAEKLAKLHQIKKQKKQNSNAHNVKSADTASFAETFEMPPVIGNTTEQEDSWNVSSKPKEVGAKRTTSESKRGLHGDSDSATTEIKSNESINFSESDEESDTTEDTSSSSSDESSSSERPQVLNSSTGGIVFENDTDAGDNEEVEKAKKEIALIDEQLSIQNRAMLVETENQDLEIRERNESGDCAYLYIVMQLCAEKTLENWVHRNKALGSRPLVMMKDWIKQLASGLDYLHHKGFIHRDLKPGNVFFSLESRPDHQILKIGDLGLATKTDGAPKITMRQDSDSSAKHTRNVGTRSYMSPEQIGHQQYTEKVDIFALGLVATELIIPFSTTSERVHTFGSFQKGEIPDILENYPDSRDFLLQLTSLNPSDRPSAKEVVSHPFLQ
uniref:PRKR-like endoplasmic reticulum kinase n=1 Tax=Caenorhabditis tropicalis TaxID=1561998 RepID=A0A1I7T3H0_9PELO